MDSFARILYRSVAADFDLAGIRVYVQVHDVDRVAVSFPRRLNV